MIFFYTIVTNLCPKSVLDFGEVFTMKGCKHECEERVGVSILSVQAEKRLLFFPDANSYQLHLQV